MKLSDRLSISRGIISDVPLGQTEAQKDEQKPDLQVDKDENERLINNLEDNNHIEGRLQFISGS
jgi:hypothetical protein